MTTLNEIKDHCEEIYRMMEVLLTETGYRTYGQICIADKGTTIESRTLYHMIHHCLQEMDRVMVSLKQLCFPCTSQGILTEAPKNGYLLDGRFIQAGDVIQYFDEEEHFWKIGHLEEKYLEENVSVIIREAPDLNLDGLEIRHITQK